MAGHCKQPDIYYLYRKISKISKYKMVITKLAKRMSIASIIRLQWEENILNSNMTQRHMQICTKIMKIKS